MIKQPNNSQQNSQEFDDLVDGLKERLLVDDHTAEIKRINDINSAALQAKIITATAGMAQESSLTGDSVESSLNSVSSNWRRRIKTFTQSWRQFGKPAYSSLLAVGLVGMLFVLMPSEPLPTQLASGFAPSEVSSQVLVDADLTFDELWLLEDELLFSDAI